MQNVQMHCKKHDFYDDSKTALIHSVQRNKVDCVAFLSKYECGEVDKDQWSALMYAANCNRSDCIQFLLSEMFMKNNWGETALQKACHLNCPECAKYLLIECYIENKDGKTALQFAKAYNRNECKRIIENYQKDKVFQVENKSDWWIAVKAGYFYSIKKYYEQYEYERTDKGETALMIAALFNQKDCVEYLAKFEIGLIDQEGKTALMHALSRSSVKCIPPLLLEIDIVDKRENDVLFYAYQNESISTESTQILQKEMYDELKYCIETLDKLQQCVKKLDEQIKNTINLRMKEEDEIMRIIAVIEGE